MRLLITGSRTWIDTDTLRQALNETLDTLDLAAIEAGAPKLTVVHGACPTGADQLADEWAAENPEWVDVERHPADWGRYAHIAGVVRNQQMIRAGADRCLAFITPCTLAGCPRSPLGEHGTHGATHAAGLAEKLGIPTLRIHPRGETA